MGADLAADTPYLANVGGSHDLPQLRYSESRQVAHRRELIRVAAGLTLSRLGDEVGQLCEGLGVADPDAAGNADPLVDTGADLPGSLDQVTPHAMQADETLVDAVDLLRGSQTRSQAHHPVAHVAVEREVRRQGDQPGLILQMANLEPGLAHPDAHGLCLVGSSNGAAIVVRQHDHRPVIQAGPKHPLATHVEVVAIDQRVHRSPLQAGKRLMLAVTTPHTSSVWPSLGVMSG